MKRKSGAMRVIKRNVKSAFLGGCLFFLFFCIPSCAINPVTGKHELMLLNESDEVDLGRKTDVQIIQQYGILDDPSLAAYLDSICLKIGKMSHRPKLDYHFKILDSSVVNAFAAPGGYVYFSRGVLAYINSEAELTGIMGHEIGHIAARHSAKQYSRAQFAQIGLGVGSIFIDSPLVSELAQFGTGMLFLRFSRDNERDADNLGVEYASKMGYDASQMANFFVTLERMDPKADRSGLPGWFVTHPSPENRVQAVRARSKEWQEKLGLKDPKVGRETYLKAIDGLMIGDDPRQGYVEENVFYHPVLRFQFPVPPKWKLQNNPSQLELISEAKDAAMMLTATTEASIQEAVQSFVSKTGAVVKKSEATQVNGLPSQRVVSEIQMPNGTSRLLSYFIKKGRYLFAIHGLASGEGFQQVEPLFDRTMRQFRELTDSKKIEVKPDRLRLRSVKTSDTLENALRSLGVHEEKLAETALLNGSELKQTIPANTLLKVIEKGR